ncbi:MAG TPA: DUF4193 family protein [Actinomycetota bacterium]|nr:DUF4193 family protein [Actinomycetota bacterium]
MESKKDADLPEDAIEELDDDLEDDDDDDLDDDELPAVIDEEDSDEASLDELLAQRAAARRGTDDSDEDDDIMAFGSERDEPTTVEIPPSKITPIKDRQEFVCSNCHLVKARVQLADEAKGLCRDCV